MNNSDFQKLASIRLEEAEVLLRANQYAGAYYLAGYAIECAIKACIAARTSAGDFPPKPELVRDYYRHDLAGLLKCADLHHHLENARNASPDFGDKWEAVKGWTEQSRYETTIDSELARDLLRAVSEGNGVLQWLMKFW